MPSTLISDLPLSRLAALGARAQAGHKNFVAYIMAGDPDYATALKIMLALPRCGVDVIELGMPFTDPMADGPAIQAAGQRALAGGQTTEKTLAMIRAFRAQDTTTPIVLMGYYNPLYHYGRTRFVTMARAAGVDGLIIVDLPPEEDAELCLPARAVGLDFIRLATPTTTDSRLTQVLTNISGFLYYVSITGITGAASPKIDDVAMHLGRIRAHPAYPDRLPIFVGFGVKTKQTAHAIAKIADGIVVGSAIVETLAQNIDAPIEPICTLVESLAKAIHKA